MSISPQTPIKRPPQQPLNASPIKFRRYEAPDKPNTLVIMPDDPRVSPFTYSFDEAVAVDDPMKVIYDEYIRRLKAHIEDGCRLVQGRHDCGWPHRAIPGKYLNGGADGYNSPKDR